MRAPPVGGAMNCATTSWFFVIVESVITWTPRYVRFETALSRGCAYISDWTIMIGVYLDRVLVYGSSMWFARGSLFVDPSNREVE